MARSFASQSNRLPPLRLIALAFQHVLVMYAAAVSFRCYRIDHYRDRYHLLMRVGLGWVGGGFGARDYPAVSQADPLSAAQAAAASAEHV